MKADKQHKNRVLMETCWEIENVFSLLKNYGIENIFERSKDVLQKRLDNCTNLQYH